MRLASSIHINYTIANQGRIRELDWGIQTLVQKGVLNFFIANYLSPTPPTPPQPLPLVAVARYLQSSALWNILLLCLVTTIVQISSTSLSRSWCKCVWVQVLTTAHQSSDNPWLQLLLFSVNFSFSISLDLTGWYKEPVIDRVVAIIVHQLRK